MLWKILTDQSVMRGLEYIWNKANVKNLWVFGEMLTSGNVFLESIFDRLEAGGKPSTWFPPGGLVSPYTRDRASSTY